MSPTDAEQEAGFTLLALEACAADYATWLDDAERRRLMLADAHRIMEAHTLLGNVLMALRARIREMAA